LQVAEHTAHGVPGPDEYAELLDNVIDCVVCHACHDLPDVPKFFAAVFGYMYILTCSWAMAAGWA
jgi:hypothetical protein